MKESASSELSEMEEKLKKESFSTEGIISDSTNNQKKNHIINSLLHILFY